MLQYLELLARVISAFLEVSAATHGGGALALLGLAGFAGLAGGAVAMFARAIIALASAFFGYAPPERIVEHADAATLLSQSDPDADGRPRPRAPGIRVTAAAR